MNFELKPIHENAIEPALDRAEHYRLLNDPEPAQSICQDVLAIDPDNQRALTIMLLALTDMFGEGGFGKAEKQARALIPRFECEYTRAYYEGLIFERRGKAQLKMNIPGHVAYESFREAMSDYERAEALSPEENDDAILRWNACARIIMNTRSLEPRCEDCPEPDLE